MPIKRRGDGKVVHEQTTPARGNERARRDSRTEAGTEPVGDKGGADRDSLFARPGGHVKGHDENWDAPTAPVGRSLSGAKTRVLAPRRDPAGDSAHEDQDDPMADPPVGWLVVVQGPGRGRALALGTGMNVIGRGPESRVRLDFGDDQVSRTNHARVAYEPRERRFLLNHGDGTNLTYLDGEVVMSAVEIGSGAEIQVGDTTLRFQAFCSAEFDWLDNDG